MLDIIFYDSQACTIPPIVLPCSMVVSAHLLAHSLAPQGVVSQQRRSGNGDTLPPRSPEVLSQRVVWIVIIHITVFWVAA
jgi:hypothetical protein